MDYEGVRRDENRGSEVRMSEARARKRKDACDGKGMRIYRVRKRMTS